MKPIQFLLVAFVLFAVVKVIHKYKQRGMRPFELFFWSLVWIGTALIIIFPDTTSFLAHQLGIGRGADLIMYTSMLIVFYLIFRIHLTLDSLEREVTEIIRAMALEELTDLTGSGSGDRK